MVTLSIRGFDLQPLFEPLVEGQPLFERRDTSARAAPAPSSAASTCRCRGRGGTCVTKLRIMKPAPASSTTVSVSSATINAPVQRRARTPAVPLRPPSLSTSLTSVFETCSAGARPKMMPVPRQTSAKKAKTLPSIVNWIQYGRPTSCVARSNRRMPIAAMPRPPRPLMTRQQHAFDQQLPDDAPARGAERDAHRNLARAIGRARQQQVRDVGARDQQHERDRAHQRQEHGADRSAVLLLVERLDARLDVLVGVGVLRLELLRDVDQLALRLLARHAGREVAERLQRTLSCASASRCPVIVRQRLPDVGVERKLEAFRHHADDRRRHVVDADGACRSPTGCCRSGSDQTLWPISATGGAPRRSSSGTKSRPSTGRMPRIAKRVGRHVRAVVALGRLAFVADVGDRAGVGAERSKVLVVVPPVAVIEIRDAHGRGCARDRTNRRPSCGRDRRSAGRGSTPRSRK